MFPTVLLVNQEQIGIIQTSINLQSLLNGKRHSETMPDYLALYKELAINENEQFYP